jgi:hypothetical protein
MSRKRHIRWLVRILWSRREQGVWIMSREGQLIRMKYGTSISDTPYPEERSTWDECIHARPAMPTLQKSDTCIPLIRQLALSAG